MVISKIISRGDHGSSVQAIAEVLGYLVWVILGFIATVILGWKTMHYLRTQNPSC